MKIAAHGVLGSFVALILLATATDFFYRVGKAEDIDAGRERKKSKPMKMLRLQEALNPLTDVPAFQVQNYAMPVLNGDANAKANVPYVRAIFPYTTFGLRNLMRISLPTASYASTGQTTATGIGNLDLFSIPLFGSGPTKAGVGPWLVVPTSTSPDLGLQQWQLGVKGVVSKPYRWGLLAGLAGYRQAIDGKEKAIVIEPIIYRRIGKSSYYLRSTAISVISLSSSKAVVPIGLGLGKVTHLRDGNLLNVYIEPQASVLAVGDLEPQFQIYAGFNIQFMKRH